MPFDYKKEPQTNEDYKQIIEDQLKGIEHVLKCDYVGCREYLKEHVNSNVETIRRCIERIK